MGNFGLKLLETDRQNENELCFTADNKAVWKLYLKQKESFIKKNRRFILQDYIDGFYALELKANQIPSLKELNFHLRATGWRVTYVDGYLQQKHYAKLLSQKIAPINKCMRSSAYLNYAPGPDMLHDIFGHLPMLFSPNYCNYLVLLGEIMAKSAANETENKLYHLYVKLATSHETVGEMHPQTKEIEKKIAAIEHDLNKSLPMYTLLGRLFMWTIEFGVLKNHENQFQMYGAGLLSSQNESLRFCEGITKVIPFTYAAMKIGYDFSSFQEQLFFSNSFEFLTQELKFFQRRL